MTSRRTPSRVPNPATGTASGDPAIRWRLLGLLAGAVVVSTIVGLGIGRSRSAAQRASQVAVPISVTAGDDSKSADLEPANAASAPAPVLLSSAATGAAGSTSPAVAPATHHSSAGRAASATKEVPSALAIEVRHQFAEGKFSMWVDDRLAFFTDLRAEKSKRLLVFNSVKGYESAVVPVPQGTHQVRLRVTAPGYDQSTSLTATFSSHHEQALRIVCSTNPAKLHAAIR